MYTEIIAINNKLKETNVYKSETDNIDDPFLIELRVHCQLNYIYSNKKYKYGDNNSSKIYCICFYYTHDFK